MEQGIRDHRMTMWRSQGCGLMRFDAVQYKPVVLDKLFHDEISIIGFSQSVWKSTQNRQSYDEATGCLVIRDAGQVYSVRSEALHEGATCRELLIPAQTLKAVYESADLRLPALDFRNPILANPYL